jgi:hypothetical protein
VKVTKRHVERIATSAGTAQSHLNELAFELRVIGKHHLADNVNGYYDSLSNIVATVERQCERDAQ